MRWGALKAPAKVTVLALLAAAAAQMAGVALLSEFNVFALVLDLILVGLAILAASGRWMGLALAAGFSGLMAVVTASGLVGSPSRASSEVVATVTFLLLTFTAALAGTAATVRSYRDRRLSVVSE
jgi:hypothetical protein